MSRHVVSGVCTEPLSEVLQTHAIGRRHTVYTLHESSSFVPREWRVCLVLRSRLVTGSRQSHGKLEKAENGVFLVQSWQSCNPETCPHELG